jgi:hypothetical protein
MEVVFSALQAFVVPLSVAILLSALLLGVSYCQSSRGRKLGEDSVEDGNKLLARTVASRTHTVQDETSQKHVEKIETKDGSLSIEASVITEISMNDHAIKPLLNDGQSNPPQPSLNRLLLFAGSYPSASNAFICLCGLIVATVIGTYVLYVPMVSTSYRALYRAYCSSDAVSQILTSRVSVSNLDSGAMFNSCESSSAKAGTALSQQDVFNLLSALGMLQPNEKSAKELFTVGTSPTSNNFLARLLVNDKDATKETVYLIGTPTSALLVHLAQALGSNKETGCKGDKGTAARTASLAVVMSQQPYSYKGEIRTVGAWLFKLANTLATPEPLTVQQLVGSEVACFDDTSLYDNGLGRGFSATMGGFPLINRPDDQVTDAQITSIALSWAGWSPPVDADAFQRQKPVLDFMRNIASQASAVSGVRQGRIAVNFFVGVERLAILIVSSFLVLCLIFQQAIGINDARDLAAIEEVIRTTDPNRQLMIFSLHVLSKRLFRHIGRSAPRELLDATDEMVSRGGILGIFDRDRLSRTAEHEMRIIDRSRFFFLAGLPLLPTIGFIGTVHSLIQALAIADNIPRARDAVDQVTAVSEVTATLSLCFSTTFMALTALLVFAPLDLWQGIRERRFVEETERILDDKLLSRP